MVKIVDREQLENIQRINDFEIIEKINSFTTNQKKSNITNQKKKALSPTRTSPTRNPSPTKQTTSPTKHKTSPTKHKTSPTKQKTSPTKNPRNKDIKDEITSPVISPTKSFDPMDIDEPDDFIEDILIITKERKVPPTPDTKPGRRLFLDLEASPRKSESEDDEEECSTPKKTILKTPLTPKKDTPLKVGFNEVNVREYERLPGGSCGVPSKGGYALGLGWSFVESPSKSIVKHEKEKKNLGLIRIPETKRKTLLPNEKEVTQQKSELEVLRLTRTQIGCECKGVCNVRTCHCILNDIECNEDACLCSPEGCKNEHRHSFDLETSRKNRLQKIQLLNESLNE